MSEAFVGSQVAANTKFEGQFNGNDTVHFPRLTPITTQDLPTSYSDVTVQNLVETDETFTIDKRRASAFEISNEDLIELRVDPSSQAIKDMAQAFASDYDDEIMAEYANAGFDIDDGDMTTATNSGAGNPIKLTKSNIYDFVTAIAEKMDENNMPNADRRLILSPAEKRLLIQAPELVRDTAMGDMVVTGGYMGMIDNIQIRYSNNLVSAAGVKHALAGAGNPICFAANIRPQVEITPSQYRTSFTSLVKAQTKYGTKVFTEGANKLLDVNLFTA